MMFDFSTSEDLDIQPVEPQHGSTSTDVFPVSAPSSHAPVETHINVDTNCASDEPPKKRLQGDVSANFLPAESENTPSTSKDVISAIMPVIKGISEEFLNYTSAMEVAVRDLATSENDHREQLQQLQLEAKNVLAAHDKMKQRFNGRLDVVSRVLGAAPPAQ